MQSYTILYLEFCEEDSQLKEARILKLAQF